MQYINFSTIIYKFVLNNIFDKEKKNNNNNINNNKFNRNTTNIFNINNNTFIKYIFCLIYILQFAIKIFLKTIYTNSINKKLQKN